MHNLVASGKRHLCRTVALRWQHATSCSHVIELDETQLVFVPGGGDWTKPLDMMQ